MRRRWFWPVVALAAALAAAWLEDRLTASPRKAVAPKAAPAPTGGLDMRLDPAPPPNPAAPPTPAMGAR